MSNATSVLFGLEAEFEVVEVDRAGAHDVRVVVELVSREAACPACGGAHVACQGPAPGGGQGPRRLRAAGRPVVVQTATGLCRAAVPEGIVHSALE